MSLYSIQLISQHLNPSTLFTINQIRIDCSKYKSTHKSELRTTYVSKNTGISRRTYSLPIGSRKKPWLKCLHQSQIYGAATLNNIDSSAPNLTDVDDQRPVNSATYRAGPTSRKISATDIDKMLKQGVIEQGMAEWARRLLLDPKMDRSVFLSTTERQTK